MLTATTLMAQTATKTIDDVANCIKALLEGDNNADFNGDGECNLIDVADLADHVFGRNRLNGYEYVDLGLPSHTLWASCNVGATSPEKAGGYYAWGETTTKSSYAWSDYTLCDGTYTAINKYNNNIEYGKVDNRDILLPEDDAATANMGKMWRTPTKEEAQELRNKCTWTRDAARNLYVITGPNGNSIIIPCAGRITASGYSTSITGYLWTANLNEYSSSNAYNLHLEQSGFTTSNLRNCGCSVRGVAKLAEYK